jgi:hypothetical protein
MFRIDKEFEQWQNQFRREAETPFKVDFDLYFLCYMMGIAMGKKNPKNENWKDLTRYFVDDFKSYKSVVATSLILSESRVAGFEEQNDIKKLMEKYFDHEHVNQLSERGMTLMNQYASAGFKELSKNIQNTDEPHHLLITARKLIKEKFKKNPRWQS